MDISKFEEKINEGNNGAIFIEELLDCFAKTIAANLVASSTLGMIRSIDPYVMASIIPLKTSLAMAQVSYDNLAEKWSLPSIKELIASKES